MADMHPHNHRYVSASLRHNTNVVSVHCFSRSDLVAETSQSGASTVLPWQHYSNRVPLIHGIGFDAHENSAARAEPYQPLPVRRRGNQANQTRRHQRSRSLSMNHGPRGHTVPQPQRAESYPLHRESELRPYNPSLEPYNPSLEVIAEEASSESSPNRGHMTETEPMTSSQSRAPVSLPSRLNRVPLVHGVDVDAIRSPSISDEPEQPLPVLRLCNQANPTRRHERSRSLSRNHESGGHTVPQPPPAVSYPLHRVSERRPYNPSLEPFNPSFEVIAEEGSSESSPTSRHTVPQPPPAASYPLHGGSEHRPYNPSLEPFNPSLEVIAEEGSSESSPTSRHTVPQLPHPESYPLHRVSERRPYNPSLESFNPSLEVIAEDGSSESSPTSRHTVPQLPHPESYPLHRVSERRPYNPSLESFNPSLEVIAEDGSSESSPTSRHTVPQPPPAASYPLHGGSEHRPYNPSLEPFNPSLEVIAEEGSSESSPTSRHTVPQLPHPESYPLHRVSERRPYNPSLEPFNPSLEVIAEEGSSESSPTSRGHMTENEPMTSPQSSIPMSLLWQLHLIRAALVHGVDFEAHRNPSVRAEPEQSRGHPMPQNSIYCGSELRPYNPSLEPFNQSVEIIVEEGSSESSPTSSGHMTENEPTTSPQSSIPMSLQWQLHLIRSALIHGVDLEAHRNPSVRVEPEQSIGHPVPQSVETDSTNGGSELERYHPSLLTEEELEVANEEGQLVGDFFDAVLGLHQPTDVAGMATAFIINLTTFTYRHRSIDGISMPECIICLHDFQDNSHIRRLPCLHAFHQACVDPWLTTNRNCPVCRLDITVGLLAQGLADALME